METTEFKDSRREKVKKDTKKPSRFLDGLEATPGLEPGIRVLQTRALPLGYVARTHYLLSIT